MLPLFHSYRSKLYFFFIFESRLFVLFFRYFSWKYNVLVWSRSIYCSLEVLVWVGVVLTPTGTHIYEWTRPAHTLPHRGTATDGAFADSDACHFLWAQEVHCGASEVAGWQFVTPRLPAVVENFNKMNLNLKSSPSSLWCVCAITHKRDDQHASFGRCAASSLEKVSLQPEGSGLALLPVDLPLFLSVILKTVLLLSPLLNWCECVYCWGEGGSAARWVFAEVAFDTSLRTVFTPLIYEDELLKSSRP